MPSKDAFYKNEETDTIWWLETENIGEFLFSFDKKTVFNLFRDYPHALTEEQVEQFDKEYPFWADFFADRKAKDG